VSKQLAQGWRDPGIEPGSQARIPSMLTTTPLSHTDANKYYCYAMSNRNTVVVMTVSH